MKQTLLLSALALAGLANAQAPASFEMPQIAKSANYAELAKVTTANCVSLDAKAARKADRPALNAPVAKYTNPANLMTIGLSTTWSGFNGFALYPAYQQVTWRNASEGATAFSWEYADPNSSFDWNTGTSSATAFAETADFVAPKYPFGVYQTPTLTATDGTSAVDYKSGVSIMQAGGNFNQIDPQTGNIQEMFGASTYDFVTLLANQQTKRAVMSSTDVFGFGKGVDAVWNNIIVNNQMGKSAFVKGLGTIVAKPEVPYMLSYVYAFINNKNDLGQVTFDATSKLKIAIHPVDDQGMINPEVLATGTCTGADFTRDGAAIFFLERQEGELVETVDLTVATGLYIEMTAESTNPESALSLVSLLAYDDANAEEYEALVHLDIDGKDEFMSASALGFGSAGSQETMRAKGFAMHLGVTYNWLYERDGRNTFDSVGPDGGVASFHMNSLYNLEALTTVDGAGQFDWWEVSYGQYDVNTGNQDMIFSFQALPAGVDSRDCVACVSTPGVSDQYFYISQRRHGGVESVVTSTSSAQVVDGNFVVSSTAADAVKVYNVAGQLVASAAVEGSAVIPAANLANGLYIVKFNDNTVVKVMK